MKQGKNSRQVNVASDMHLKNIFESNSYLELGVIDIDVMSRILSNEIVDLNDIVYFPNQNKGLGKISIDNETLRNYIPHFFFLNLCKNSLRYELAITYGLLKYHNEANDKKETFVPVFIIPINLYYENQILNDNSLIQQFESFNSLKVQLASRPELNQMCMSIFANKLSFIQTLDLTNIEALDYALETISKMENVSVTLGNYLTYRDKKNTEIIFPARKNIVQKNEEIHYGDKFYRDDLKIYLSHIWSIDQRVFIEKATKGESLVLTGVNGSGKTAILKDIIVNNMQNNKRTLFISNNQETIDDVNKFLKDINLNRYSVNLTESFEKINDVHFEDLFLKDIVETKEELVQLNGYYDQLEKYENDLNGSYNYYKITEMIGKYYRSSRDLLTKENREIIDDVSDYDKIKYDVIYESLKSLEDSFHKIKTFKDSIWNAIPVVNQIENKDSVLNTITTLKEEFSKIRELEIRLFDFGIIDLASFADLKSTLDPIVSVTKEYIPEEWRKSKIKYKQALAKLDDLVNDIHDFDAIKEDIDQKYVTQLLIYMDIQTEIGYLYGDVYQSSEQGVVNDIIKDRYSINRIMREGRICIDDFNSSSLELQKIINWKPSDKTKEDDNDNKKYFLEKDEYVHVLKKFNELCNKCVINGKMYSLVSKNTNDISKLTELYNSIVLLNNQMEEAKKEYPLLSHIDFEKKDIKYDPKHDEIRQFDILFKKAKTFKRRYMDLCGVGYRYHEKNLYALEQLKNLNEELKAKRYRKIIFDYIQSLDEPKYIEFLIASNKFFRSFNNITLLLDKLSKYKYKYDKDVYLKTVVTFDNYISYLNTLYGSNERILNVIKNPKRSYPTCDDYYDMKKHIDMYHAKTKYFSDHAEYSKLYGYLYKGEATDVKNVETVAMAYNEYASTFVNDKKVYESFEKFDEFRYIVEQIDSLVKETVNELNNYNKMFKDGTNRYYFSKIETNVEYLNGLIQSEEELILYLSITKEINKLDKYGLKKIIKFISENDNIENISKIFSAVYFDSLVKAYFKDKSYLFNTDEFLKLLDKIKISEDYICKCKGKQIISSIINENPVQYKVKKYKTIDYDAFLRDNHRRLKVYLSDLDFASKHIEYLDYDVIIIDDSQSITSGSCEQLLRDKQFIISGDYLANATGSSDLLSKAMSQVSKTTFRNRYELIPSSLASDVNRGPYYNKLELNKGVEILTCDYDELVNYIYRIYCKNNQVKINLYIKAVETQRDIFDKITSLFYKNKLSSDAIIQFLNKNIFISDLSSLHYNKADYNIVNYSDYEKEDSNIVSSNYVQMLSQTHMKLVIYDRMGHLEKKALNSFGLKLMELANNDYFQSMYKDGIVRKMEKAFTSRGYVLYYPGNDINIALRKEDSDEVISVVNLFSNYNLFRILDIYRLLNEQYVNQNQKIVFTVYVDLLEKHKKYEDLVISKINKL